MEEEVKSWIQAADVKLQNLESKQNDTLLKLAEYEKAQEDWKANISNQVTFEIGKVTGGIGELYNKVELMLGMFDTRLRSLENEGKNTDKNQSKSLLLAKDMKPTSLDKEDQWRRWKSDIEDYCEEVFPGMKDMLDKARDADVTVDEVWFEGPASKWWERGDTLYRFLKRYTGTEARRVVLGVAEDNGWEAWRKLNQQYEPATVTREAQVLARYTNMVTKKAKTPRETKTLLNELSERAKRVEEITGRPIEDRHAMSVIAGLLDPETAKHTAQYQGARASVELLKQKVMEFINLVTASDAHKMDLDRVQQQGFESESGCWDTEAWDEDGGNDELNAFGEKCHTCGGVGHYARECPTKAKGKGKGGSGKGSKGDGKAGKGKGAKGDSKGGKGKGKAAAPMYGSCWTCGGAHFSNNCPKNNTKGGGGGTGVEGGKDIRVLSSLQQARRLPVITRNSFQALDEEDGAGDARQDEEDRMREDETRSAALEKVGPSVRRRWDTRRPAREAGQRSPTRGALGSFVEVARGSINSVEEEWQEIELAVDSGATETVVGTEMLTHIATSEGEAFKRGVQYEVASGELIDNLGEKNFVGYNEMGEARSMKAQVCDVNKALLSVKRMVAAGNRVVFEPACGYIEDVGTGDRMQLKEKGGMYMLKLWVQKPFQGQAASKP